MPGSLKKGIVPNRAIDPVPSAPASVPALTGADQQLWGRESPASRSSAPIRPRSIDEADLIVTVTRGPVKPRLAEQEFISVDR